LRDVHLVLLGLLTHPLYGWAALKIDNYSPIHRAIRLPLHGVSREPVGRDRAEKEPDGDVLG